MLLFIISLAILIIGIACVIIYKVSYTDGFDIVGGVSIVIGVCFLVVLSVFGICIQCLKTKEYDEYLYKRQVLEYRLEKQDENLTGNELLYSDIVEFNTTIYKAKRYSKNLWINWYVNDKLATIDYIEIDGITPRNL
jgi:hypothetical protein